MVLLSKPVACPKSFAESPDQEFSSCEMHHQHHFECFYGVIINILSVFAVSCMSVAKDCPK